MNGSDIFKIMRDEFGVISRLFILIELSIKEAMTTEDITVAQPGVYILLRNGKVVKVGRHIQNSRKRVLEHIRDNTGGKMASLKDEPRARIVLLNLKDITKVHWLFALEVFLEQNLEPEISSKRLG